MTRSLLPTRRRRFPGGDRGVILPLTALTVTVVVLATALAVDLGRQSSRVRDLQQVSDSVSLDLARQLDGRDADTIINDPTFLAKITESTTANDFPVTPQTPGATSVTATGGVYRNLLVELGRMCEPRAPVGDADECFTAVPDGHDAVFESIGQFDVPDAVRVTAEDRTDYFFVPGGNTDARSATGTRNPQVWNQVGSVAAGFDASAPAGTFNLEAYVSALNGRLTATFKTSASAPIPPGGAGLDLVGYQGLAAADVFLSDVAAAAGFASANEMLESNMTAGQFFDATITALNNQGDAGSANAATQLDNFRGSFGSDFDPDASFTLLDVFHVDDDNAVVDSQVNVLDLLNASGQAINGTNLLDYDIDLGIPGVAVTNFQVAAVESEQRVYGPAGVSANTEQLRFAVELELAAGTVGGILSPITIPLVIEAAQATSTTTFVECLEPLEASESGAGVTTSALNVHFGTSPDLTAPGASFQVDAGVVLESSLITAAVNFFLSLGVSPLTGDFTISGTASFGGGSSNHVFLPFESEVNNPPQRSMGGIDADIGTEVGSEAVTNSTNGVTNKLIDEIEAEVITPLSEYIINPLLQMSGISVGGADVHEYDDENVEDCGPPSLVE